MRNRRYLCTLLVCAAALTIGADLAAAAPVEVTHTQALGGQFNTCNGELVFFEGTALAIDRINSDGSIDSKLFIKGTGTGFQGNEYVLQFHTTLERAPSGLLTLDSERATLVSKGTAPNQIVVFYFSSDLPDVIFTVDCHG